MDNFNAKLRQPNEAQLKVTHKRIRLAVYILLLALGMILLLGYWQGWFTSADPLIDFISRMGILGYLFCGILVIVNTIVPVIPGSLPAIAMFMAYGPLVGFASVLLYNIIGSCISFMISRKYGENFVKAFVAANFFDKYFKLIKDEATAIKLVTFSFLVPGIPDDALTMVSGLTNLRFSKFFLICLFAKPIPTFVYLFGFSTVLHYIISTVGQIF